MEYTLLHRSIGENQKKYTKSTTRGLLSYHDGIVLVIHKGRAFFLNWRDVSPGMFVATICPHRQFDIGIDGIFSALTLFWELDEERGHLKYFCPRGNNQVFVSLFDRCRQKKSDISGERLAQYFFTYTKPYIPDIWTISDTLGFWYAIALLYGHRKEDRDVFFGYKVALHYPQRFAGCTDIFQQTCEVLHTYGFDCLVSISGGQIQSMVNDFVFWQNVCVYDKNLAINKKISTADFDLNLTVKARDLLISSYPDVSLDVIKWMRVL